MDIMQQKQMVQQQMMAGAGAPPLGPGAPISGPPGPGGPPPSPLGPGGPTASPEVMPNAGLGVPPPMPTPQAGPNVPEGSPRPGGQAEVERLRRLGLFGPRG